MNGAPQVADHWSDAADEHHAQSSYQIMDMEADDDDAFTPADPWPRVAAVLAVLVAIGWLVLVGMTAATTFRDGVQLADVTAIIRDASPPLILITLVYLLAVRTGRSEAARMLRVSEELRAEQSRLDATLISVSTRIDDERLGLAEQTDRLMTIGEDAAGRLRAIAEKLKGDIDHAARDAEALRGSSQAARSDMTALLADLPRARAQTVEMIAELNSAGMTAHERAGALDAQISTLVARGREADEVAGGAAQKLAAHLARVEGVSETAGAHLVGAAEAMTSAIDAALDRAAQASDAARQGMEAQGAAMRALVDQSEAALSRTGADASEAIARRIEEVTDRLEGLGAMLVDHEATSTRLVSDIATGIDRIDDRFATIDAGADARNDRLSTALGSLATHADTLAAALDRGGTSADTMIAKTETLMTALDATVREIDETLPAAFVRLDGAVDRSSAKIAAVAPEIAGIEREASAALDRLLAAEKLLSDQRAALDSLGTALDARLTQAKSAAKDLVMTVEGADNRARELADGAGTSLVDAMVRVRESAMAATERAREALASIVPDSAERLSTAVREAFGNAVTEQIGTQISQLAATAEQSVAAANTASDRLMRQMLTIAETSAQVETRILEAHAEIEEADRENFTRRVALLIESLNSTAIDVTKLLSNDVTDSAWNAYLKGDRGVFTRRAVRLLDAGEAREILRHYNSDPEFGDQVNRYVHDFEGMLRNVLSTRAGSALGVTLLSSDMGKLYVALAQAIERLRT
ncbi:MAG: hypothetical protein ABI898_07095 [Sphingomonadales bacterium]